jgi:hypothetical protein
MGHPMASNVKVSTKFPTRYSSENSGQTCSDSTRLVLDICAGIDKDPERAWEIFEDALDSMYVFYLEGRKVGQYEKRGRPAKGGVVLSCSVRPDTKVSIEQLAKQLECSQGEAVDFLYAFFDAARTIPAPRPTGKTKDAPSIAAYVVAEPEATYATTRPKRKNAKAGRAKAR